MAKSILVFIALSICLVQCAVLKRKDDLNQPIHKREKRSCHVCDDDGPPPYGPPGPPGPPPPPPPPFFRTQQWSGLARSDDGLQQGVFSGAAAASGLGNQATGQAFSVASSSAGAPSANLASGQGGVSHGNSQSSGFGSQSSANSASGGQSSGNGEFAGQKKFSGSGSFKESHYSFQNGGNKPFEGHEAKGAGPGTVADGQGFGNQPQVPSGPGSPKIDGQQQAQSGGFNAGSSGSAQIYDAASQNEHHEHGNSVGFGPSHGISAGEAGYSQSSSFGSQSSANSASGGQSGGNGESGDQNKFSGTGSFKESHSSFQSGENKHFEGHGTEGAGSGTVAGGQGFENQLRGQESGQQQVQTAGNGQWHQGGSLYESSSHNSGSSGYGQATGREEPIGYSTLNGALNLASQGLQTSQQTGCSTCGKSSYALSNAKSKTGNAVAVSIGG